MLEEMGIDLETVDPSALLKHQVSSPLFHIRLRLDPDEDTLIFHPGPPGERTDAALSRAALAIDASRPCPRPTGSGVVC